MGAKEPVDDDDDGEVPGPVSPHGWDKDDQVSQQHVDGYDGQDQE